LGDLLIAELQASQFTGDVSMILGRPAHMHLSASGPGEVVELTRRQMLALIQTDAEISEILMRALIHRRVAMLAEGIGDVVVIGSAHSAATLRIKAFLTRNGHPFSYLELESDPDVLTVLDRFHISSTDLPVMIGRQGAVLRNPDNRAIAERLGFNDQIDEAHVRDVVIVGAGPAGLAAAVYAASEGLDTLVIEGSAPGGQAGTSSRIENYLGFPTGISGQELAGRAYAQARKFGADVMIARAAVGLACTPDGFCVRLDEGGGVPTRTVIVATGAQYRKPDVTDIETFEGVGVYYSATFIEAQLCEGEDVMVVGGGNAAGQAAVFLARTARRVFLLVRGDGLSASMSHYLVRRIEESPNIHVRLRTELVGVAGSGHLACVRCRDGEGGVTTDDVRHLFLMTGAEANSTWLGRRVTLDEKGFVRTGFDLTPQDLTAARWPLARAPHLLETSLPGVFAIGDVRCGNVKRVASAVGEGSIAISFVHRVLNDSRVAT